MRIPDFATKEEFEKDPFRASAAYMLNKQSSEVTKEERQRLKEIFFGLFCAKAGQIITDMIEDVYDVSDLPEVQKILVDRREWGENYRKHIP